MSVLTPVIQSIDGSARRIYLKQGVSDFYPIEDIYHEYRALRRTDESLRVWEPLLKAEGNIAKGGGAFTPRYVVLLLGTKLVPFDEPLQVNQLGDMITDNPDVDSSLYDISGLTGPKPIFIKPSEAETIQLNSSQIEFASYNGGITVDVANLTGNAKNSGNIGTGILGNLLNPCDNLTDAGAELLSVGLSKVYIIGNLTVLDEINWARVQFVGDSQNKTSLVIDPIAVVQDCEFSDANISGTLDGNSSIKDSIISGLTFVDGTIENCFLGPNPIVLGTDTQANFVNCRSNLAGPSQSAAIDMNVTGILAIRDFNGGGRCYNYSGSGEHSIDLSRGQWTLENTIVSGTFVVRGIGKLVDENGNSILSDLDNKGRPLPTTWNGGVTILNELLNQENIARGILIYDTINLP